MNQPRRREVERFIHVDSRDCPNLNESKYEILFGFSESKDKYGNIIQLSEKQFNIPIQDYNNVIKIELKTYMSSKPSDEDYVFFKIKNIDGKVDSTSTLVDSATVCYFESQLTDKKPIYFGGNTFEFNPPIAKLSKLNIDILKRNADSAYVPMTIGTNDSNDTDYQSFLLKITYIEGNLY